MKITPVPMLMDNYAWLVEDGHGAAAIVDVAEADVALSAARARGVKLVAILSTHHHGDHTAGNEELAAAVPGIRVFGYAKDASRIPAITDPVEDGGVVRFGALTGRACFVPCHTSGHVAYAFGDALFTGDTLFAAGCGRFFEGSAKDMYHALYEVIGAFPDSTWIHCGHEYTASNLRFASHLEPDNAAVRAKLAEVEQAKGPTVPTQLGAERTYNPFLRVTAPGIKAAVRAARQDVDVDDPVAVLGALRAMKDVWKG